MRFKRRMEHVHYVIMTHTARKCLTIAQKKNTTISYPRVFFFFFCCCVQVFRDFRRPFVRPTQDVGGLERRRLRAHRRRRACRDGRQLVLGTVAGRSVGRFRPVGVRAAAAERRPVSPSHFAHRVHQLGRQPVPPGPRRAAHQGHTKGTGQIPAVARPVRR